jgi:hypothetical protein
MPSSRSGCEGVEEGGGGHQEWEKASGTRTGALARLVKRKAKKRQMALGLRTDNLTHESHSRAYRN